VSCGGSSATKPFFWPSSENTSCARNVRSGAIAGAACFSFGLSRRSGGRANRITRARNVIMSARRNDVYHQHQCVMQTVLYAKHNDYRFYIFQSQFSDTQRCCALFHMLEIDTESIPPFATSSRCIRYCQQHLLLRNV
jgi:hypothetical protein